jgi:putative intracellular protease/amidase
VTNSGKRAYLYAFEGMADWEYGYLAAELNSGRYFQEKGARLELATAALELAPLRSMGGIRILPDILVADIEPGSCALLVLPGGESWLEPSHRPAVEKAAELLEAGVPVAAICGATFALAAAGLLDDRAHTSNDLGYLKAMCPAYRGEALYLNEPAVLDRGLVTASGLAPLEFAHRAMGLLGPYHEESLAAWLDLNQRRGADDYGRLQGTLCEREST